MTLLLRRLAIVPILVLVGISCVQTREDPAEIKAGEQTSQAIIQRVFAKLIGRNPKAVEVKNFYGKSYEQFITDLLNSNYYQDDIFYRLHEQRLLLNPEGNPSFLSNARNHYCGMRWDMARYASSSDYWDILTDTRHWIPVATRGCFSGLSAAQVIEAVTAVGANAGNEKQNSCVNELNAIVANSEFATLDGLRTTLEALSPAEKDKGLLFLEVGQKLLKAMISQQLFPDKDLGLTPREGEPKNFFDFELSFVPLPRAIANPGSSDVTSCEYVNVTSQQLATTEYDYLFFRVNFPDFAAGIHGTPYYLNRHYSKASNSNLHRGRMLYFSYLCEDLPPSAANPNGDLPLTFTQLDPYFSPADKHATSAGNCYQCHSVIQPLGNFFSRLTWGRSYNEEYREALSETERPETYPAGLWQGSAFYGEGNHWGLSGLRETFASLPQANRCIISSLWSQLGSKDMAILPEERLRSQERFASGNYKEMLLHVLTKEPRIRDYLTKGEITVVSAEDAIKCDDPKGYALTEEQSNQFSKSCSGCHANTQPVFYKDDKLDLALAGGFESQARLLKGIYCEIIGDEMPPASYQFRIAEENKKQIACHYRERIRDLVQQNGVSEEWLSTPCVYVEALDTSEGVQ